MKKNILAILALLFSNLLLSQINKIDNNYSNYFQNTREIPYLHLNKTSFFLEEEIWFKAYILEQNSKTLHKTSSNLYVSIFDDQGNLKDQKLVQIENGIGKGSIKLDSTYINEHYYIKASTNWMRNFNEDNSYYEKIQILTNTKKLSKATIEQNNYYEFKILPEGGHIIANCRNNLGILIKDRNNKGIEIEKGIIKNNKGTIVKEFFTNEFGLGNVNLNFSENEVFHFEALLKNGISITQNTITPKTTGITLRIVNSNPKKVNINIKTNKKSLNLLNSKSYTIFIHNTSDFYKKSFTFNPNDTTYSLVVKKNTLPKGINIITVFNDSNIPVCERLIYIHDDSLFSNISVKNTKIKKDSMSVLFKNNGTEKVFLSASFMPLETKAYNPKNNIFNTFILAPHVKGPVENINYYFKNTNHKKLRDLDLLLLTQGWSRYNWNEIFNSPPLTKFDFENGITIKGKLNLPTEHNENLIFYSKENNILRPLKIFDNSFELKNTFFKENSTLEFALTKNNKNPRKIAPALQFSKGTLYDILSPKILNSPNSSNYELSIEIKDLQNTFRETEILKEVEVKKKRDFINQKDAPYGAVTMLKRKIPKNMIIPSGLTVLEYLKGQLYNVSNNESGIAISPRGFERAGPALGYKVNKKDSQTSSGINPNTPDTIDNIDGLQKPVRTFLDNVEITDNLWIIESMYLDEAKEIYYGRVFDNRSKEHIYIYSLSPSERSNYKPRSLFSKVSMKNGFTIAKEYYSPEFYSYTNNIFKNYGAIHWNPNISINPSSSVPLFIPTKLQDSLKLYLEGISESGKLISQEFILK